MENSRDPSEGRGFAVFGDNALLKMKRGLEIVLIAVLAVLLGSLSAALGVETVERERTLPEGGLIGRMRKEEEAKRKQAWSDPTKAIQDVDAAQRELEGLNNSVSNALRVAEQTKRAEEASGGVMAKVVIAAGILGAGIFLFGKFGPKIGFLHNVSDDDIRANNLAEEKSFLQFVAAFKVGPTPDRRYSNEAASDAETDEPLEVRECRLTAPGPLEVFLDSAPISVAIMRGLIQEITRATGEEARHKLLAQLCERVADLKCMAGRPGVLPVWQLATALEGLLRQLTERHNNVTASTLRTVASAVDLLEALSVAGIKSDLLSNPPMRLLAVDDDALSRHAVSFALKKALNKPDLAENGEAAMALVSAIKYDAIFLDVQMPGMDGFETCTKIHGTELNRVTPVVFVTCQSDFDARAKSTLSGGNDLIGKPFLTFEITVKALTLAFRGRLNRQCEFVPRYAPESHTGAVESFDEPITNNEITISFPQASAPTKLVLPTEESEKTTAGPLPHAAAGSSDSPDVVVKAFLTHAPGHIRTLRIRLEQVGTAGDAERQERLVDLYLAVHSFRAEAELANLPQVVGLSSAIEAQLKRSIEDAKNCGPNPGPVGEALDLLGYIFASKVGGDLAHEPAMNTLSLGEDVQTLLAELASRLNPDQQQTASAMAEVSPAVDLVEAGK